MTTAAIIATQASRLIETDLISEGIETRRGRYVHMDTPRRAIETDLISEGIETAGRASRRNPPTLPAWIETDLISEGIETVDGAHRRFHKSRRDRN